MGLTIAGGSVIASDSLTEVTDLVIEGERIHSIGSAADSRGFAVLDATGSLVMPGFIDVHSHTDESALRPDAHSKLLQGITTEICGQCGGSPGPLSSPSARMHRRSVKLDEDGWWPKDTRWRSIRDYLDVLDVGIPSNQAVFAGWWSVHDDAIRFGGGNFAAAIRALEQCLTDGSGGVSIHEESRSWRELTSDEQLEVFRTAADANRIVSVHVEATAPLLERARMLLDLSTRTGARLQLSHVKILGKDESRSLAAFLELVASLDDDTFRFDVTPHPDICTRAGLLASRASEEQGGSYLDVFSSIRGLTRGWVLLRRGESWTNAERTALAQVATELPGELVIAEGLSVDDIAILASHPWSFVGTDGPACPRSARANQHQRAFDAFPTALELRLRSGATPTELAQQLATRPATWFGITERGLLAEGAIADVTVVDLDPQPRIRHVVVNGQVAVQDGLVVQPNAGRPIRVPSCG